MKNKNNDDLENVAAVIRQPNGLFHVYKCSSKEDNGFRRIIRRFGGFSTYGKALAFADNIERK